MKGTNSGVSVRCIAISALVAASATAQGALRGNGIPSAYVETTPAVLGGHLEIGFGSPSQPNGVAVLSLSGGYTTFNLPLPQLGGPIALDVLHPAYQVLLFPLDAQGHGSVAAPIANNPALLGAAPYFANTVTFESPTLWSVSKTVRIDWIAPGGFESASALTTARQLHTATSLGSSPRDNLSEVLICGGATGSFITPIAKAEAELFSPVSRATTPLPNMLSARSGHRTVRLNDGRIMVTGGVTTGGSVLSSCEFFDPATLSFTLAPPMQVPRSGHALTLLNDGRVLVSGGVTNWQNVAAQFIAALNTTTATAEVFDPATNSWSSVGNMTSKRLGHSQTLLPDGTVLVVSGIRGGYAGAQGGGQVPLYATSCQVFQPSTNTFTWATPLHHVEVVGPLGFTVTHSGRAFHTATVLPNGNVLITGGFAPQPPGAQQDETISTRFCDIWDANTGLWSTTADLPTAMTMHTGVSHNGGVFLAGGFNAGLTNLTPTNQTLFHDGSTISSGSVMAQGRAAHTMTRLNDGSLLLYGGAVWPSTLSSGTIYLPN